MKVVAHFLNGGGVEIGSTQIGPVLAADRGNTTGFVFRSVSGAVPPGTRTVRVEQVATRAAGGTTYNNAYSDKVQIRFRFSDAFIGTSTINIPFDNDSTASGGGVHLQEGTLNFSGGGPDTSTGSFVTDDGGSVQFSGGTENLGTASSITGPGTGHFSGGTINVEGIYNPSRTTIDGGTTNFDTPSTTTVLNQSSGVFSGTGTFTINGPSPGLDVDGRDDERDRDDAPTRRRNDERERLGREGPERWPRAPESGRVERRRKRRHALRHVHVQQRGHVRPPGRRELPEQPRRDGPAQQHGHGQEDDDRRHVDHLDAVRQRRDPPCERRHARALERQRERAHERRNLRSAGGTTLSFTGGTHDLGASSSVTTPPNTGNIRFQAGQVNVSGAYNVARTEITGATANFLAAAGTREFHQSSGILTGSGAFTINTSGVVSDWTGGTMTGPGLRPSLRARR